MRSKPVEILLIEDNPGDTLLTQTAFKRSNINNNLNCVERAEAGLEYLRDPETLGTDLILLDLNLPQMTGPEFLEIVKADPDLRKIPVVVLSSSDAESDIHAAYQQYANSFVTKPLSMKSFIKVVESIENFWFQIVKLP